MVVSGAARQNVRAGKHRFHARQLVFRSCTSAPLDGFSGTHGIDCHGHHQGEHGPAP